MFFFKAVMIFKYLFSDSIYLNTLFQTIFLIIFFQLQVISKFRFSKMLSFFIGVVKTYNFDREFYCFQQRIDCYISSIRNKSRSIENICLWFQSVLVLDSIMNLTFMLMGLSCAITTYANCTAAIRLAFSARRSYRSN